MLPSSLSLQLDTTYQAVLAENALLLLMWVMSKRRMVSELCVGMHATPSFGSSSINACPCHGKCALGMLQDTGHHIALMSTCKAGHVTIIPAFVCHTVAMTATTHSDLQ